MREINLLIHGDVEIAPGRFVPGVVHSSMHETHEAAQAEWDRLVAKGLYEEPFETFEIRDGAPTLGALLETSDG